LGDNKKEIIGVVLLNLGGPDSIQAVRPFLYNLFSDRQIIKLSLSFMQRPLAWLISTIRSIKTKKMYSLIGNKSPILDITMAQAKALEEALNLSSIKSPQPPFAKGGDNIWGKITPHFTKGGNGGITNSSLSFRVYVGMRYWYPLIEEVIPEIYNAGINKLIVISLYPQYSVATSGSSLSKFKEVASRYPMEIFCISSFFNHPLYIEALVDVIKKGLESFGQKSPPLSSPLTKGGQRGGINSEPRTPNSELDVHVLFSAHSLPQKIIDEGDPYVYQIMGTIEEITKIIQIKWHLSYQSKSGPVKWLEPSTDEKLKELAGEGVKNVLVVPISFVSDHIETLYEIDILYKNLAEKLGIKLKRVESLNTHPVFIGALKDMVQKNVKEAGWV
jgi:ferrochelatase